jgi:hypothetical protein
MKTSNKTKVRNSCLRAIDQGTIYDVTGKLRGLARSIDRGEEGDITDAVVILRGKNGSVGSFHYGNGSRERAHYLISTVKNRLEPA